MIVIVLGLEDHQQVPLELRIDIHQLIRTQTSIYSKMQHRPRETKIVTKVSVTSILKEELNLFSKMTL